MNSNDSASSEEVWFRSQPPIFERTFGALENGVPVEKTELLTREDVEKIIGQLLLDESFMSVVREYVKKSTDRNVAFNREEDAALYSEITTRIDLLLKDRELEMAYFFSNSLAVEILNRTSK